MKMEFQRFCLVVFLVLCSSNLFQGAISSGEEKVKGAVNKLTTPIDELRANNIATTKQERRARQYEPQNPEENFYDKYFAESRFKPFFQSSPAPSECLKFKKTILDRTFKLNDERKYLYDSFEIEKKRNKQDKSLNGSPTATIYESVQSILNRINNVFRQLSLEDFKDHFSIRSGAEQQFQQLEIASNLFGRFAAGRKLRSQESREKLSQEKFKIDEKSLEISWEPVKGEIVIKYLILTLENPEAVKPHTTNEETEQKEDKIHKTNAHSDPQPRFKNTIELQLSKWNNHLGKELVHMYYEAEFQVECMNTLRNFGKYK